MNDEPEDPHNEMTRDLTAPTDPPHANLLDYRPAKNTDHEFPRRWYHEPVYGFMLGLIGGTGVSVILWGIGWNSIKGDAALWLIDAVLAIKLVGGIAVCSRRRWQPLGIGVITSIGLGCLIFGISFLNTCKPI